MLETILLIISATLIGMYHNTNKPTQYELNMEDGSNTKVVLQKNSQYACPLYCEVEHIHHAVVCKDENQISQYKFVYHISKQNENGVSVYCSTKKILSMSRFKPGHLKNDLPDIVSASTDE